MPSRKRSSSGNSQRSSKRRRRSSPSRKSKSKSSLSKGKRPARRQSPSRSRSGSGKRSGSPMRIVSKSKSSSSKKSAHHNPYKNVVLDKQRMVKPPAYDPRDIAVYFARLPKSMQYRNTMLKQTSHLPLHYVYGDKRADQYVHLGMVSAIKSVKNPAIHGTPRGRIFASTIFESIDGYDRFKPRFNDVNGW